MEKKMAKYILKRLYVDSYLFLNDLIGFALEQMSIDTLQLHTCMFSIDKGSAKNDEILRCAHSRHCGYCSVLCLAVVENAEKECFMWRQMSIEIIKCRERLIKCTSRDTKQYTNFS